MIASQLKQTAAQNASHRADVSFDFAAIVSVGMVAVDIGLPF
jgi:hypothetical protein